MFPKIFFNVLYSKYTDGAILTAKDMFCVLPPFIHLIKAYSQ